MAASWPKTSEWWSSTTMNSPCFEKSKFHKERKVLQIVRDPVIAPLKIHGSNLLPRIPPSTTNGVSQPARTEEAHQTPSLSPCRSLSLSLESVVNNCTTRSGVEVPRVLVCILFRVICLDILIADRSVFLAVQRDRSGFRTTVTIHPHQESTYSAPRVLENATPSSQARC